MVVRFERAAVIFSPLRAENRFQNADAYSHSHFLYCSLLCFRTHARPRARARASAPARFERIKKSSVLKILNKSLDKKPGMIFSSLRAKNRFQNAFSFLFFVLFFALPSHTRAPACARARERARAFRENKKEQRIKKC